MIREIIFDTETTGLKPTQDRIIEIGCVEMIDKKITNNKFHCYINPEQKIDPNAIKIHGITDKKVKNSPKFKEIADDFLKFVDGAKLVAHNAEFDMNFINEELKRLGKAPLDKSLFIDTLAIARKKFPTTKNTLDALCKRYKIDFSQRTLHGALLDAQLLALVYIELTVVKEMSLVFEYQNQKEEVFIPEITKRQEKLVSFLSNEEKEHHKNFIKKKIKNPLWEKYIDLSQKS